LGGDGGYDAAFQGWGFSIDLLGGYYTRGAVICQAKTGDSEEVCGDGLGRKVKGRAGAVAGGPFGDGGPACSAGRNFPDTMSVVSNSPTGVAPKGPDGGRAVSYYGGHYDDVCMFWKC